MVFDMNWKFQAIFVIFVKELNSNQPFWHKKKSPLFAPEVTLWFGISRLAANFPKKNPWSPDFVVPLDEWRFEGPQTPARTNGVLTPKISKVEKKTHKTIIHPRRLTWNMSSWRFGSDHVHFFSWVICMFHFDLPGWLPDPKKRWVFKRKKNLFFKTSVLVREKLSTIAVYKFNPFPDISKNPFWGIWETGVLKRSSFRIGKIDENPWRSYEKKRPL